MTLTALRRSLALLCVALLAIVLAAAARSDDRAAQQTDMQGVHRQLAASCFSDCWTLIERGNRTPAQDEQMLLLACASLWHWRQRDDCTPANLSIGYWQVSRVNALLGQADAARLFGQRCLQVAEESRLPPFYQGYGHEALCRAAVTAGDLPGARVHLVLARQQLLAVAGDEERQVLRADLDSLATTTAETEPAEVAAEEGEG